MRVLVVVIVAPERLRAGLVEIGPAVTEIAPPVEVTKLVRLV
jgi:hypothetical protein